MQWKELFLSKLFLDKKWIEYKVFDIIYVKYGFNNSRLKSIIKIKNYKFYLQIKLTIHTKIVLL